MPDKQKTLWDLRSSVQYGNKNDDKKPIVVATIAAIALAVAAWLTYHYSSDKPETPASTTTKVAK